jgi:tRNA (cytidine32/guanosine34-2'-O)-methyltransferase
LPNRPLIKLTDFGLSRFINPTLPLLTTRCGSESFAGPEIIMGRPYDGRDTDSWACGVVLYALITGELPFDEPTSPATNGKSPAQKQAREEKERRRRMMRIAKGNFTWPEGVGSDEVRRVVGRLLVRDPKKRTRVSNIWEEQWMEGPGGGHSNESDGVVTTEGGRKGGRRVGDGWLGDEDPEDAGLYGEAD